MFRSLFQLIFEAVASKRFIYSFCCFFIFAQSFFAQEKITVLKQKRILFILDASGSMNEKWNGLKKWNIAVSNLSSLIDSFTRQNKDVEIGIRLLGHQFSKELNICTDSKLELPFAKSYTKKDVEMQIGKYTPKGNTPLAYALEQAEKDFQNVEQYENTIILITDGVENCFGMPCEVAQKLTSKRIVISPYIIGLGIDTSSFYKLECIGKFVDVRDKDAFSKVVKSILTEVSLRTTLDIRFFNTSKQQIYNIPFSLYDKRSGLDIYNFIKTQSPRTDTIHVNSQYRYRLEVHTLPEYIVEDLNIVSGKHNVIDIPLNIANFEIVNIDKSYSNLFVIKSDSNSLNHFWDGNLKPNYQKQSSLKSYVLSVPYLFKDSLSISEEAPVLFHQPSKSTLLLKLASSNLQVSLLDEQYQWIMDILYTEMPQKIDLITGNYILVFKEKDKKLSKTKQHLLFLKENQIYNYLIQ